MHPGDFVHDRGVFGVPCRKNLVGLIDPGHRQTRRNADDLEAVHLAEFRGLCRGRASHAAHAGIKGDEVLDRNRSEDPALLLQADAFFELEGRLQFRRPSTVGHDATLQLVYRPHRIVRDEVIDIPREQPVSVKGVVNRAKQRLLIGVIEVAAVEGGLHLRGALRRELHGSAVLLDREIDPHGERTHEPVRTRREGDRIGRAAGNHERNARFVDEDRIDFVDDRRCKRTVHELGGVQRQTVAKVVEANFGGRGICHVRSVRRPPFVGGHRPVNGRDRQPHPVIDDPHPLGVAAGQIVVGGQHVHALAGTRVPGDRRHRRERLPFARRHLDDVAFGKRDGGANLDVEHGEPEHPGRDDRGCRDDFGKRDGTAALLFQFVRRSAARASRASSRLCPER